MKTKHLTLIIALVCVTNFAFGQEALNKHQMVDRANEYNLNPPPAEIIVPLSEIANYGSERSNLLYSNGPLITAEGVGFGGGDVSVVQNTSMGMNAWGFAVQYLDDNRIADDFVVDSEWTIESIKLFGYQTMSFTGISTLTGAYLQIWDGSPDDPDSNVIWGDLSTNRMTSTSFTNVFRMLETESLTANSRAIMEIVCETPGLVLNPGAYWIDFSLDGSAASGPWHPPITIIGQTTTGNALQYFNEWSPMTDSGSNPPQGATFEIYGSSDPLPVPLSGYATYIVFIFIVSFMLIRYHRII